MKTFFGIVAATGILAATSFAQGSVPDEKMAAAKAKVEIDQMLRGAKVIGVEAGIMGPTVKGQPYTADEIHETTQVLADGTRIHNETKTTIYRDSQGRIRRESPGQVMIWDSTAGSSYMLNQSDQTAQKMHMAMNFALRKMGPGDLPPSPDNIRMFHFSSTDTGEQAPAQQTIIVKGLPPLPPPAGKAPASVKADVAPKKEVLESEIIEGVKCEGTRTTTTIEAGAIGNDRPIQTVEEKWYSPELQVNMMVRKTDPRTGEDVVRLTNVRRLEPDPSLFTIPSSYQVK